MKRIITACLLLTGIAIIAFSPTESAAQASQECGTTPSSVYFQDGFENSLNWQSIVITGSQDPWSIFNNSYLYGSNLASPSLTCKQMLTTAKVTVAADAYLHFVHKYDFDAYCLGATCYEYYDGGVVEYSTSTDGGVTWSAWNDAGSLFVENGYNATLYNDPDNPLGGSTAFSYGGNPYIPWIETQADLSGLAGKDVRFRFCIGTNNFNYADQTFYGWLIDEVLIDNCLNTSPTTTSSVSTTTINPATTTTSVILSTTTLVLSTTTSIESTTTTVPDTSTSVPPGTTTTSELNSTTSVVSTTSTTSMPSSSTTAVSSTTTLQPTTTSSVATTTIQTTTTSTSVQPSTTTSSMLVSTTSVLSTTTSVAPTTTIQPTTTTSILTTTAPPTTTTTVPVTTIPASTTSSIRTTTTIRPSTTSSVPATTTVPSTTTTTTGQGCPFVAITDGEQGTLSSLRQYRNRVLLNTPAGREYIKQFYAHSVELTRIMLDNPAIAADAKKTLDSLKPDIQAAGQGKEVTISKAEVRTIISVLNKISSEASPELSRAIQKVKRDLRVKKALGRMGVKVSQQ